MGAHDQVSRVRRAPDAQQRGHQSASESLEQHRRGDHQKDQRPQLPSLRDSLLRERSREQRRYGRRHDAARRQPRQERALAEREAGARRAHRHVERPDDKHEGGHRDNSRGTQGSHLRQPYVRGEEHEQEADQQDRELLLELLELPARQGGGIADHHAGDGRRHDPTVGKDHLGRGPEREQEGQREDACVALGDQAFGGQQPADHQAADHTDPGSQQEPARDSEQPAGRQVQLLRQNDLECHHCDDGGDGVDEDAFGFQDRVQVPLDPNAAQEGG